MKGAPSRDTHRARCDRGVLVVRAVTAPRFLRVNICARRAHTRNTQIWVHIRTYKPTHAHALLSCCLQTSNRDDVKPGTDAQVQKEVVEAIQRLATERQLQLNADSAGRYCGKCRRTREVDLFKVRPPRVGRRMRVS
jgi:hypothetical protein